MKGKSEEHIAVIIRIIRSLIFFSVLVLSGNFNKLKIYLYLKLVIVFFIFCSRKYKVSKCSKFVF